MMVSDNATTPEIVMVCYGGGHVNMMIPIYQRLRRDYPELPVQVLGLTSAQPVLKAHRIPFIGFKDLPGVDCERVRQHGGRLVDAMGRVQDRVESIAYMGASFVDLIDEIGEQSARVRFNEVGRQAFLPVRTLTRYLEATAPRLVIATSAPRAERAAIMAAGSLGIPSICLVDLFAGREIEWLGQPGFATTVCVIAESVRQKIIEAGRSENVVRVTGNPAFDELNTANRRDAGVKLRQSYSKQGPAILAALQPEPPLHPETGAASDPELPAKIEHALLSLARRRKDLTMVLRRHPSQPAFGHEQAYHPAMISRSSENLAALLHSVDCVITCSSTVGLQGLLLRRPLVALQMSVTSAQVPYATLQGSTAVETLDAIEAGLDNALAMSPLTELEFMPAGYATEEILKLIIESLTGNNTQGKLG